VEIAAQGGEGRIEGKVRDKEGKAIREWRCHGAANVRMIQAGYGFFASRSESLLPTSSTGERSAEES